MQDNEIIEYKGIKIGVLHTGAGKLYEVRYNKNRADWPEYYKLENAKKYIDILLTKSEQAANASWETAKGENRSYQPDILLDDILSWFEDHEQAKEDLIVYLKNNRYTDEDIKDLFGIVEESLNESSKANYTIEYYLNTATADRRPSTKEDVEEDYIYDTIRASNDLEALEEAFFIQTGEDYYEEIFDDYRVEDTVEGLKNYFDSRDIGDGSIIICKITQGSRVIYDSTLNKQFFLDEVDEDEEEDDEDLMDESLNGEKLDSYTQKYVDNAVKQVLEWFQDIVEEGQLDKDNEDPYYTGLINLEELIYIYTSDEATYDLPYEGPYAAKDPYNYSTEEQERFDNLVIEQALPKVRELYNKYLKKRDLICLK